MAKLQLGVNDLGTVRPDLADQLVDPSEAETVTAFSMKKLLWFCKTGHPPYKWAATVANRSNGSGCGVCAGKSVLVGWNDLGTVNPGLAAQLVNPSDATTVTVSSGKKLLWLCETNHPRHEWEAIVAHRSNGSGCNVCAGKSVLVGWNDLETVRPELAKQLVDLSEAETVTEFSNKKLLWFCDTGHQRYEWKATVNSRSNGRGCGACAGQDVIIGWNDLGTVNPELAKQLVDPDLATTVTKSSGKKLLWFCETNHPRYEWESTVANRSNDNGCGACAGQDVIIGWNDLGTVNPELAKQLVDPDLATTVTKSSGKKLLWFCEDGHPRYEWEATVNSRSNGHGCGICAEHGYDSSKSGDFYRFEFVSEGQTFLCYGISNVVDKRRKTYERQLEIKNFQSVHFEDGAIPQEIEKQFHEIRKKSLTPASTCGVYGTITESFPITDIDLSVTFETNWVAALQASSRDHLRV